MEEQKVNRDLVNKNNEKPIDLASDKETIDYLSQFMGKTDKKFIFN
jgi:hypothetical protein